MNDDRHGSGATTDTSPRVDRRRPGVRAPVREGLLPLMRGQDVPHHNQNRFTPQQPQRGTTRDPLSTARGVALAILICGTFWVGIAALF